ncbi:hypothetical protein KI688_001096 [Linnemannia hyalina]|uniref:Uncharacterized protein n=1 Tax=Linnemannia hyalina TaxID=64524 RepID=A0A9P7Y7C4_9FUNG|nr:hypothetical protein KI688_001096 [Linnemannia hyalina]
MGATTQERADLSMPVDIDLSNHHTGGTTACQERTESLMTEDDIGHILFDIVPQYLMIKYQAMHWQTQQELMLRELSELCVGVMGYEGHLSSQNLQTEMAKVDSSGTTTTTAFTPASATSRCSTLTTARTRPSTCNNIIVINNNSTVNYEQNDDVHH